MKKLFLAIFILAVTNCFAQKQMKQLSFKGCHNPSVFHEIRNNTRVLKYIAANGAVLKVGDTLVIGRPSGSSTSTEVTGRGSAFSKTRSSFTDIIMGKPAGFGNVMNAMNGQSAPNAGANMEGEQVVISEMKVFHKGSRKKPLRLTVLLGQVNGRAFGIYKHMYIFDYNKAVMNGEIKSLHAPLTPDQALAKLKRAKELVDLGLMKPEKFNALKKKLAPIIMKK